MDSVESIAHTALALPRDQRIELADRLLASFESDQTAVVADSAEMAAEVQRRSAEMDSGDVSGVSWDEVRDGIDERLKRGAES